MYVWIGGALIVLIVGMISYTLGHPRTAQAPSPVQVTNETVPSGAHPRTIEGVSTFELSQYETGDADGWSITPMDIVEDSRCPSDVQCIQAGTVRLLVALGGDSSDEVTLTLGQRTSLEEIGVLGHATLVAVTPSPVSTKKILNSDYRFTLVFENN